MHFTYFCKKGGGGGRWTSVLCSPSSRFFLCFQTSDVWFSVVSPDDVNIFGWYSRWSSSFCVLQCFCSLLGFMSDDYSFVVAFVVTSSIWIYICIFRCTFRLSIDVSASLIFFVLITVPVISFFVVTCGFLSAAGGREVLFSFRQTA